MPKSENASGAQVPCISLLADAPAYYVRSDTIAWFHDPATGSHCLAQRWSGQLHGQDDVWIVVPTQRGPFTVQDKQGG